ncbi:MAG: GNAT family N-acetyltransferase [bacterium]
MHSKHEANDPLSGAAAGSPEVIEVIRSHLELRDIAALRPARPPLDAPTLARERLSPNEYRELYSLVGGPYQWRDRLLLRDTELDAYFASPNVHLWTLRVDGQLAGYFELQRYSDMGVEIMYFGLAPGFIGRGLGGWLLTRAVEESFALSASRVTLHTCTLDSPHALPNYLARGFVIVREERYFHEMKSTTPLT